VNATHASTRRHALLALGAVLSAALAGCASSPSPRSAQTAQTAQAPQTPPARPEQAQRNDIALFAMGLLDTRYRWGGRGPATGFDCSGLVSHVFKEAAGLRVQGSSADLAQKARPVSSEQLLPGDLVFFNTLGTPHSHVGVYVGDGRFVHASNPRTGVRIDQLSHRYYAQRFEGAGSLLD
jgi:cell wall-associated NlpC family hydrolase